jgi:hypothetical protein
MKSNQHSPMYIPFNNHEIGNNQYIYFNTPKPNSFENNMLFPNNQPPNQQKYNYPPPNNVNPNMHPTTVYKTHNNLPSFANNHPTIVTHSTNFVNKYVDTQN